MIENSFLADESRFRNKIVTVSSCGFPVRVQIKDVNEINASIDREEGVLQISLDNEYISCLFYSKKDYGTVGKYKIGEDETPEKDSVLELVVSSRVKQIIVANAKYTMTAELDEKKIKVEFWENSRLQVYKYEGVPTVISSGEAFNMELKEGGLIAL